MNFNNEAAVARTAARLVRIIERAKLAAPDANARRKVKRFQNIAAAMARAYRVAHPARPDANRGVKYGPAYKARGARLMMRWARKQVER